MFYHGLKYYIAITRSFKSIFVSISINKSFTMLIFDDSIMDGAPAPTLAKVSNALKSVH